jgi:hypothetical protein
MNELACVSLQTNSTLGLIKAPKHIGFHCPNIALLCVALSSMLLE